MCLRLVANLTAGYRDGVSDLIEAAILGVVQGLTEFLPISSTGHLILAEKALGIQGDKFGLRFDAAIHLGTLTAVLIYFRLRWLSLAGAWFQSLATRDWQATPDSRLAWLLLLATIPAGLIGLAIESTAEDTFRSPALVAVMLIAFCLPMLLAERLGRQDRDLGSIRPLDALLLGLAQSIALIPGVSRSGITISAGMLRGFRREEAAAFAFLLSAPIIAAAGGKQIFDIVRGDVDGASAAYDVYAVGLITAAMVGYVTIAFLLRFLRTNPLNAFIIYRVCLGVAVLGLVAAGVL
ncbi:MAG: undecaprenyl-diphosphatase UppP [Dehalococcoidia bacterium]|nr:undecaprenyl-diphosphatase UppP [Dehalococcoidia bacterium]